MSAGAVVPRTGLLRGARPAARWLVRRRYDVHLHGAARVPSSGPVVLASNHVGFLDGPLLATFAPRPVHALAKRELFAGPMSPFLRAAGQIPVDRTHPDPAAVRSCLAVLARGGVVGIFPEGARGAGEFEEVHGGAAYLALVTGAPVVPVTLFGTRERGAGSESLPPKGARVDMVFGAPYRLQAVSWPRTQEQVGSATVSLRSHLLAALEDAKVLTGRELPGTLPAEQDDHA
ncbi:lysophospholipid acyltransferase family protein [Nocardioides jiangxiensis]|uniref:Lysophospholipid acyltransferase family protein n=1 Tax=Nocardioides jiangxiensis TaxID=3064524 RepID=A0ABT9AWG7_9ACTN|nr:lysophospholipid acyltransferase family protein [Nocardioides sp. WY-20]MDO7866765.1 lysophospholipid acyltransferase family protein [Nocardioides sp. WY-20]